MTDDSFLWEKNFAKPLQSPPRFQGIRSSLGYMYWAYGDSYYTFYFFKWTRRRRVGRVKQFGQEGELWKEHCSALDLYEILEQP